MALFRHSALTVDPMRLLSTADLDEILHLEAIRPPHFAINMDGESVPVSEYTRTIRVHGKDISDVVRPEVVHEYFRKGAMLTWHAVNHFLPNIRDLTDMLSAKFATDCRATAFLTPGGQQGLKPHHDPVDVFACQLEGRKRWMVWSTPTQRRGTIVDYTLEELGDPQIDVILEPGDIIYVPYDTPHLVRAEESQSLHLSALVLPRRWKEILRLVLDEVLEMEELLEFPYLNDGMLSAQSDKLRDLALLLAGRLQKVDTMAELNRIVTGARGPDDKDKLAKS